MSPAYGCIYSLLPMVPETVRMCCRDLKCPTNHCDRGLIYLSVTSCMMYNVYLQRKSRELQHITAFGRSGTHRRVRRMFLQRLLESLDLLLESTISPACSRFSVFGCFTTFSESPCASLSSSIALALASVTHIAIPADLSQSLLKKPISTLVVSLFQKRRKIC
jgi:hypothetical protein